MHQRGFAFILPVIIVGSLILIVLAFVFISTDEPQSTKVVDKQEIAPTITTATQKEKFISIEEIKALILNIVWEETIEDTKKVFFYDNFEPNEKVLTGESSFSSQVDISVDSYFGLIDDALSSWGWEQSPGADGPTGGIWGYKKEINGKTRYVEFSYINCGAVGATCEGTRDGNTVFYSDEFDL